MVRPSQRWHSTRSALLAGGPRGWGNSSAVSSTLHGAGGDPWQRVARVVRRSRDAQARCAIGQWGAKAASRIPCVTAGVTRTCVLHVPHVLCVLRVLHVLRVQRAKQAGQGPAWQLAAGEARGAAVTLHAGS